MFAVESNVFWGLIVKVYETAIAFIVDTLGVIDIDWKPPAVGVNVIPVLAASISKPSGSYILNEKVPVASVYAGLVTELTSM